MPAPAGRIELPLYREWLQTHPQARREELLQHLDDDSSALTAQVLQSDDAFVQALNADTLITPQDPRHAAWREQRSEFERLWQRQFTERHLLRYSELAPDRLFTSMFLHGGFGHLLGNMFFLWAFGIVVEGKLGWWKFLGVYMTIGIVGGFLIQLTMLGYKSDFGFSDLSVSRSRGSRSPSA